jgi:N-acyl homoserine lactone hydrolase
MKKLLTALGLVLLVGIVALVISFMPAELPKTEFTLAELPPASPPPEMRLSAMRTGTMESKAGLAWRGGSFGEPRMFSMAAVLVQHPKGDVLIDTGFGRNVDAQFQQSPFMMRATTTYSTDTPAAEQLRAKGYDFTKLSGIVLTHAHWDHVSGIPDFGAVPVWVNAAEHAFIEDKDKRMTDLVRSFGALDYKDYGWDGGAYLGYPQSHDVWGDGSLVLVPSSGYTPGSVTAFVNLPSGARYAFVGDTVWQREGITLPAERPWFVRKLIQEDTEKVRREIWHLNAISKQLPMIRLMPAHDASAQAELPVFPDFVS